MIIRSAFVAQNKCLLMIQVSTTNKTVCLSVLLFYIIRLNTK